MPTEYRDDASITFNGAGGIEIDPVAVDTAGITAPADTGSGRKRRKRSDAGQPRGSRTGTTQAKSAALDLSSLTGMFVGIHVLLGELTKTPELGITEEEGKQFMSSAQNVMRHYSVQTTQKTLDWIAFTGVSCTIYAPRIAAVGFRRRSERTADKNNVTPLRNQQGQNGNDHLTIVPSAGE